MDSLFELFDIDNINEKTKESVIKSNIPGMYEVIEEHESKEYSVLGRDVNTDILGWFYPVYVSPIDEPYHTHDILIEGDEIVTFYMPNGNMNHGVDSPSPSHGDDQLFNSNTRPYVISLEKIKRLLKNIKHNLYQKKTTKEAISFFFKTIISEDVEVILDPSGSSAGSIDIKLANLPRTDDYFLDLCRKLYEDILHPIGINWTLVPDTTVLRMGSEQKDNDFEFSRSKGSRTDGFTFSAFEMPLLGNYYVYHSDDTVTLQPVTGCSDLTPIARGITTNDANMPTYTHPNWLYGISGGTSFGDINISDFMTLPFENNPNFGITSCANLW